MKNLTFLLILVVGLLSSCTQFFQYSKNVPKAKYQPVEQDELTTLDERNFLVVHYEEELFEIYEAKFNPEDKTITAKYRPFEGKSQMYYVMVKEDEDGVSRRRSGDNQKYVRQVHFFLTDLETSAGDQRLSFLVKDVSQIDVMNQAVGANTAAAVPITVVATAGSLAALLIIACNCPHVYVHDGTGLVLNNSLFTGSKAPQLERFDYKQIPDYFSDSSQFSLQVVNELNEDQFTNLLELMVVQHPENVEVLSDKTGKIHSIVAPQTALSALDNDGENILESLSYADDAAYRFDPDSLENLSAVNLKFQVPAGQSSGKLVLRAKNSQWAGYVYNEFNSLFGENHAKWVERNKNKSKEEREQWMRQEGIKLLVDVKTPEGWKQVDDLELVGEANFNSLVIELDSLPPDAVEIRLRSGYWFWELDYVAMDFSADLELNVQVLQASSATDNKGNDYLAALSRDDANYMAHLHEGTSTTVNFENLPVDPTMKRSLILRSKGYYISKQEYTGKTQRKELVKFKKAGELSRYSKRLHQEFLKQISLN